MSHLPEFQDHIPNTKDGTSPSGAVTPSSPFAQVVIDFLGPLYIENEFQEAEKAYVCLFTCCATRAVHLELTCSQHDHRKLSIAFEKDDVKKGQDRRDLV